MRMSESTPPAACTRGEEPTVTVWMALTSEQQCKVVSLLHVFTSVMPKDAL